MAISQRAAQFVDDQVHGLGEESMRRMFGECFIHMGARRIPASASLSRGQSDKFYGALLIMVFKLRTISLGTT